MEDIGSIFPLYETDLACVESVENSVDNENKYHYFSLCREAFLYVADLPIFKRKVLLCPAFTCSSVYQSWLIKGWNVVFYDIQRNFEINIDDLLQKVQINNPDLLIVHPYFGNNLSESEISAIRSVKNMGCKVLLDITQNMFYEDNTNADFITCSLRKWFQIPDGAYLKSYDKDKLTIPFPIIENTRFVQKQIDAMYLRGIYFQSKDENIKYISIRLNKEAVRSVEKQTTMYAMSNFAYDFLRNCDVNTAKSKRENNYKLLEHELGRTGGLERTSLYYPLFCEHRDIMQSELAKAHIYAPILWPCENDACLISDNVRYLYDNLLSLPIDQRYGEKDMKRIVNVINQNRNLLI